MRTLILAVLLALNSVAYSQELPQAPRIKAEQKANDSPKTNKERETINQNITKAVIADNQEAESKNKISEFWMIFGRTLKSTDSLLVIFTALLFFATWALWRATKKLVNGAEDTARKELRAYVALDDIYFRWIPNPNDPKDRRKIVKPLKTSPQIPPRPRIRVKNYGHTPANNMIIRINGQVCSVKRDTANNKCLPIFKTTYDRRDYQPPMQMLAPTQVYGVWVHLQDGTRFDPHKRGYDPEVSALVIYGAITYEDIYNRWWVTRFCYIYDGYNRFVPHTDYNREQQYKSQKDALDSLTYI